MLEYLPDTARGKAFIEVVDRNEVQSIANRSAIEVQWLLRNDTVADSNSCLVDAVRETVFPVNGEQIFVWCGCEFEDFRAIRGHLRTERSLGKDEHLVVSYWRREE